MVLTEKKKKNNANIYCSYFSVLIISLRFTFSWWGNISFPRDLSLFGPYFLKNVNVNNI